MATLIDERARAGDSEREHARLQLPGEERDTALAPPVRARHVQRLASGQDCGCARCAGEQGETLSPVARHVLDLQQRLGNRAVVQMLADGVQRSPVTDAFGTRDVPGFREGPDARAEGEALAREAQGPPAARTSAEDEEEAAQLAVDGGEESEEEAQLDATSTSHAIEEEEEEVQLSSEEGEEEVQLSSEEEEEEVQLSAEEEDEEAAQLFVGAATASHAVEEEEEEAQLSTASASATPSQAVGSAEVAEAEIDGAGAGLASGGIPDSALAAASVNPPPGGGTGAPLSRPATPARIDVPALRERLTLTPIQRLAEDSLDVDTAELDDVDTSSLDEAPESGEPDLSSVDSAADSLESARPSGGGGIVDAAIDTALSYLTSAFSSAVSMVRGGAGEARSQTQEGATEAETTASEAVTSAKGEVTDAASETAAEAQSEASASADEVRSEVGTTRGALRGMMRSLGGTIRPRIQSWLQSAGSDEEFVESVVGPIRAQLQRQIARLQSLIERVRTRLTALVERAAARLTALTSSIAETLTSAVDAVQRIVERVVERVRQAIQGVIDRAVAVIRNVPAIVMELISGLVHRAVAAVRRVVDLIVDAARRVIDQIFRGIRTAIEFVRRMITAIIEALRRALTTIIDRILTAISSLIDRIVAAIHRAAAVIAEKVRAIVGSVMRAILRVAQVAIEEFLRPQLEAARAKAREAYEEFQRIMPILRQYAEQARRQMRESLDEGIEQMVDTGSDVIDSLLNPDGDHFAIGGQINAEVFAGVVAGAGVGAHVSGSYAYDFVADYAHNQIGIFFTIAFAAGGNIGVGASAEVDVGVSVGWGTQYNLASKKDVADAAGGYNATFGVGVGATAELEGGVAVSTGHSFSMSLDTMADVVCPKDEPTPSPTPTPTPGPEPTPEPTPEPEPEFDHHPLDGWIVFFPTGGASLDAADLGVVSQAAQTIPAEVARYPDAAAVVSVDGHSSPRWRRPRPDETATTENQALSGQRATAVFEALRARMPDVPGPLTMTSAGHGDEAARTDGADPDSDDQRYRIATISGEVVATRPGTGSLTTGGGGTGAAGSAGSAAGVMQRSSAAQRYGCAVAEQLPAPPFAGAEGPGEYLRSRPYGWDTTMYAGVAGGAGISASYSADIGLSRAFELWSSPKLNDRVMQAIRLMIGMLKLGMDVATMSPVSFVRDAISIAPAVGDTAVDMLLLPITMIEITLDIADG